MNNKLVWLASILLMIAFATVAEAQAAVAGPQIISCKEAKAASTSRVSIRALVADESTLVVHGIKPGQPLELKEKGRWFEKCPVKYEFFQAPSYFRLLCLPAKAPLKVSSFDTGFYYSLGVPTEPDFDSGLRYIAVRCTVQNY